MDIYTSALSEILNMADEHCGEDGGSVVKEAFYQGMLYGVQLVAAGDREHCPDIRELHKIVNRYYEQIEMMYQGLI